MSAAWVLVWLGASAPTANQRVALESYELAHGLATHAPAQVASAPVPYPARVAKQLESALERARTLTASLQDTDARTQLERAKQSLSRHPELPQAAWLMAECLRLEAQLLSRSPDAMADAQAALRAAMILDGGRALGVDEAELNDVAATLPRPIQFRVDIPAATELSLDGAPLLSSARSVSLPPGLHHVRVTRRGRQLYAAWVELGPDTPSIPLPVASGEPCSEEEFAALRRAPENRASLKGIRCERWLMARPAPGPTLGGTVQVRSCEGSSCGEWLVWSPNVQLDFAGPAQAFDHDAGWPDWATYVIVGASAVAITGIVFWQLGTFDSAEPGKKKWVYQAPAALSF